MTEELWDSNEIEKHLWRMKNHAESIPSPKWRSYCFDKDNGSCSGEQMQAAKLYVEHWDTMFQRGMGLIFTGPPDAGKTFCAACIANALFERDVSVKMLRTNDLLTLLADFKTNKSEVLKDLDSKALLILDDLGADRRSAFTTELLFEVIDRRVLTARPLIITTNLTAKEIKDQTNLANWRIFSRILEGCVPIPCQANQNRIRQWKANVEYFQGILEGTVAE